MSEGAEFQFRSRIDDLDALFDFIDGWCSARAVAGEAHYGVRLAAEEFAMNAIMHGYGEGRDGWLGVRLARTPDTVVLEFKDEAPAFDVLATAAPALSVTLEDRPIGGLGLHLIRTMARSLDYQRRGRQNVVTAVFPLLQAQDG